MADKNVDIKINTTANTDGAKAADQALTDLQRTAEGVREQEANAARESAEAARAEEQAEGLKQINRKATALVLQEAGQAAQQAAAGIRQFANEIRDIDPESAANIEAVAKGFDTASVAAQGAALGATFGGAYGAAAGAIIGPALSLTMAEVQAAMVAAAQLKALEKTSAELPGRIAQVKRMLQMREEIKSWEDLTNQMREAADIARFVAEMNEMFRRGEEKNARADVDLARATGGDVEGAEARLRDLERRNFDEGANDKLKAAYEAEKLAANDLWLAESSLRKRKSELSNLTEEAKKEELREIQRLEKELPGLTEKKIAAQRAISKAYYGNPIDAEIRDKQDAAQQTQKGQDNAVGSLGNLIKEAKGMGGGSPELQSAMKAIEEAAKDGTLSKDDMGKVEMFFASWRDSLLRLGVLPETFEKAVDAVDNLNTRMKELEGKMPNTQVSAVPAGSPNGAGLPAGVSPAAPGGLPSGVTPGTPGSLPPGMSPIGQPGLPPGMSPGGTGQLPPGMAPGAGSGPPAGMSPTPNASAALEQMKDATQEGAERARLIGDVANGMREMVDHMKGLEVIPALMQTFSGAADDIRRRVEALEIKARG